MCQCSHCPSFRLTFLPVLLACCGVPSPHNPASALCSSHGSALGSKGRGRHDDADGVRTLTVMRSIETEMKVMEKMTGGIKCKSSWMAGWREPEVRNRCTGSLKRGRSLLDRSSGAFLQCDLYRLFSCILRQVKCPLSPWPGPHTKF